MKMRTALVLIVFFAIPATLRADDRPLNTFQCECERVAEKFQGCGGRRYRVAQGTFWCGWTYHAHNQNLPLAFMPPHELQRVRRNERGDVVSACYPAFEGGYAWERRREPMAGRDPYPSCD